MGCSGSKEELPALAFLGLCDAGKSTIIAYIQHKAFRLTHPTLGVEISTAVFQDKRVDIWDVSGRDCSYWSRYYKFAVGIVFVVDGTNVKDAEVFTEYAKLAFSNTEVQKIPVLFFINKIDEEEGESVCRMIKERLNIDEGSMKVKFQICDPKTGDGIIEGFNWIMELI